MEHLPNYVAPKDVEAFNPKDRKTILSIDEALADYDAYVGLDHMLAVEGLVYEVVRIQEAQNG